MDKYQVLELYTRWQELFPQHCIPPDGLDLSRSNKSFAFCSCKISPSCPPPDYISLASLDNNQIPLATSTRWLSCRSVRFPPPGEDRSIDIR